MKRRTFLVASTAGCAGLGLGPNHWMGQSAAAVQSQPRAKPAKSTILFFLCGGSSHIDMWDMKPNAPMEYRGPFSPQGTKVTGVPLCEHLPLTGKVSDHLAIVHGVTDGGKATGDHHAGYYYNLTGQVPDLTFRTQGNDRRPYPDDWPFMGSVVGSRRPLHPSLPQVISLPHKPSKPPYTRPGQFAARLGVQHDPFYLSNEKKDPRHFLAPSLSLEGGLTTKRMNDRRAVLEAVDDARSRFESGAIDTSLLQQEKAFRLLSSSTTANAFDLTDESESTIARYGETVNGMSLLMARRLVEAGVPFVTVFWKEDEERLASKCKSAGGWDTHGNNFECLKKYLLPEFDQCYSALIGDLFERNMLDETLVLVTSEMGRKPRIGDPRSGGIAGAGRDHWTACQSVVFAGGGIRGGQVYGETDKHAEYPAQTPIWPSDVTQTVYHAMGIREATIEDKQGRPFDLLAEGKPLRNLF